ncbi:MAG TPA: arginine--tRNA ligase [Candidatus Dormibacteraeota bacterium]|jgi:arginyl-tRNA synthetase|nr:arginine--tRNA ligase [Candidatus Dormibacteraeota bacterium]
MPDVHGDLVRAVRSALDALGCGPEVEVVVEPSARPEFGDWSTPAAMRAARTLRRPPPVIAGELRDVLAGMDVPRVREWTTSGSYVNARLDERGWAPEVIDEALARDPDAPLPAPYGYAVMAGKTLVEHTNINTNKAAHIGHLRNACLGDTVARLLRRTGHRVEVNDYIDDTGVQVADVVVGVRELGLEPREGEPFDQFCSRAYVEVSRRHEAEPELAERRRATLRAIEERDNEVAEFAKTLASRVVDAHLATMARFDIGYDLLTWESDILELGFWRHAFEQLRAAGAIVHVESGKLAGCWVMPWDDAAEGEDEDAKVLVKSDGVATYTAKDIAYQLWKFGLLGLDFHYRRWHPDQDASPATTTAAAADATLDDAGFGHAARVVNVIDARQAYLQRVVRDALHRLGHRDQAENSVHLAYEVVALTPAAARELGVEVAEGGPAVVALSGRRGIEVRADDLLDLAVAKLGDKARDPATARALAAAAVRYYLLKFSLTQIIAFDFDEALRVTGDTGVYLQYAHARAAGILRRTAGDAGDGPVEVPDELLPVERALLHRIEAYPIAVAEAAAGLAPVVLAVYAFSLASAFSDFYEHTPPIVREEDPVRRRFRRALTAATRATLGDALRTLGMSAPDEL